MIGAAISRSIGAGPFGRDWTLFAASAVGTNTVTLPSHRSGDLLVMASLRDGSNSLPGLPTGWTAWVDAAGDSTSARVAYLVATSSSETNPVSANATAMVVHVYRPQAGESLTAGAGDQTFTSGTTVNYPGLTLETADGTSIVATFGVHREPNTSIEDPPTGTVARSDSAQVSSEAAGHDTAAGVTSWSGASVAVGGTSNGNRGFSVEIKLVPSSVSGTGLLVSQAATISGVGVSSSEGTGLLVAGSAIVLGEGNIGWSGTGLLVANDASVFGEGEVLWEATGLLISGAAEIEGEGTSGSTGTGLLIADAATIIGSGAGATFGSGLLVSEAATILGEGISSSAGTGLLISGDAVLVGRQNFREHDVDVTTTYTDRIGDSVVYSDKAPATSEIYVDRTEVVSDPYTDRTAVPSSSYTDKAA